MREKEDSESKLCSGERERERERRNWGRRLTKEELVGPINGT